MGKTFSTGLLTNGIWQDASNNIGIGAANSSYKFQVTGTTNLTGALSGTSATFSSTLTTGGKITANGGGLLLDLVGGSDTFSRVTGNRGNGDNLHVANIEFYNSFSTRLVGEVRGITGAGGTQSNSGQLAFYTNDNGTYAERMKIYSEGQIGIKGAAVSEAAYALFTNDANTGFFNIFAGGSGTATKGIKLKVTSGSSTIDAMTITSGGNVQIGTVANSSNNIFEVYRNDVRMVAQDNNNGTAGYFMRVMNGGTQVGNATVRVDNAGALKFFTGTSSEATQMTITSGGQVCINTTLVKSRLGTNTKFTVAGATGAGSPSSAGASIGSVAGTGGGSLDTGIDIEATDGGLTLLFLASRNTSGGTNTASAVYIISFYYSGTFPVVTYLGGTSNFVTFGQSGTSLTATNAIGYGNFNCSWFASK